LAIWFVWTNRKSHTACSRSTTVYVKSIVKSRFMLTGITEALSY